MADAIRLPDAASKQLPSRGQVAVNGTINGEAFQTVLEPDGASGHWMRVAEALKRAAGVGAGDLATLSIAVTREWPEPSVPQDLATALASAPQRIQDLWDDITPMARWEWVRWVNATKNPDTFGRAGRREHLEDGEREAAATAMAKVGPWCTVGGRSTRCDMGSTKPNPSAQELLADWRAAERLGKTARSAAESAGLAVESADASKAAASSAQAAVAGAAEAVDRAKEASDLASEAAAQASEAAQRVYADAKEDVKRTGEGVREADAIEAEAGDAFREAQREGFAKDRK